MHIGQYKWVGERDKLIVGRNPINALYLTQYTV